MTDATLTVDATSSLQTGTAGTAAAPKGLPSLSQKRGHEFTRILGIGAARGENLVPNDDLVGPIDSSDEWIRQRTGIVTRARASEDVHAVDLAEQAAREALDKAGISADQLGVVLISTVTNTVATPSMASLLAERIGAAPAAAYDISAACAGYAYGIAQADSFIKSGVADYVLVVGAEKLSDIVDPADRSISFLLGDGAGAAVIGPSEYAGIAPTVWGSDGSKWDAIHMTSTFSEWRRGAEQPTIRQEGQTVFRWAVWEMVKVAREALEVAGITADQLAAFVPHQANMRIIDEFAKQLGIPENVVIGRDITTTGNTSAASIPLATHRLLEQHPELHGGLALQIGFGAGLVFGAQVVVLP
jgi:3-oxoacyl-[acyl-carrier-protein] synthase III